MKKRKSKLRANQWIFEFAGKKYSCVNLIQWPEFEEPSEELWKGRTNTITGKPMTSSKDYRDFYADLLALYKPYKWELAELGKRGEVTILNRYTTVTNAERAIRKGEFNE